MRRTRQEPIDFFGEHFEREGAGNRDRRFFFRRAAPRSQENEAGRPVKSPAVRLFPILENRRDVRFFFETAFKRRLG